MAHSVQFNGQDIQIEGTFPSVGEQVKPLTLTNKDLASTTLDDFADQRKVLNIFPSVDTGVCATSVRTFNQLASQCSNTVVLCISADLPFAQARFCGAENLQNVIMLSNFRSPEFASHYGVAIASGPLRGLTTRAVIVLDENNKVLHSQLVDEVTHEPDYEAALAVL